jgi:methyl-accepting chemotaxis protein
VNTLAGRSNLLAVNAAIEAAKAGEVGWGFAVVAAEIKGLAEQSKQATVQVRGILGEIHGATHAAVMASEDGVKAVEAVAGVAAEAGQSIVRLTQSVMASAQAAQQIVVSVQQQVTGMEQVAGVMQQLQQGATQSMAATRQVERAAQDLTMLARRLQGLVGGNGTDAILAGGTWVESPGGDEANATSNQDRP